MLFQHLYTYGKVFSPDGEGGGGAGATSGGGTGAEGATDGNGADDGDSGDEGGDELAGLKKALEAERKSRKQIERDFKAAQKRLSDIENAGKSDDEKLVSERDAATARADAAEQRLRDALASVAVTEAATKANAVSIRAVHKLIADEIEYDDEGQPTNIDALIAQAKKDEPTLFRAAAGSADGGKRDTTTPEFKGGVDRLAYAYGKQSSARR